MPRRSRAVPAKPHISDPTNASPRTVHLGEKLDLPAASELARSLLAARGADIVVDASAVQHLGAQSAQVLLAARACWTADHASFRIADSSPEFMEAARWLGLGALLAAGGDR